MKLSRNKVGLSLIAGVILLICFFNIFSNLGDKPLHQDENVHFSAAYGFKETGDFVKWDFLNNRPLEEYNRNFVYTYAVYASNSLFGWSEFSTRLPGAIIGFLGVILIYIVVLNISKKQAIALAASYLYAVNDIIIYFARFARGYVFLMFIAITLFYLCYLITKSSNKKDLVKLNVLTFLLFILGLHFHPTAILILPAILISTFIFFVKNYPIRKYHSIYLIFLLVSLFLTLNIIGKLETIPSINFEEHVSLEFELKDYSFFYMKHLTNPYNFSYIALFILPILFIFTWRKNRELAYNLFSFVYIPIILSIYMFNRYEDFRYIAVIQPIFIILLSSLIYYFIDILRIKKAWKFTLLILALLLLIPFQFPGVYGDNNFVHESQATWDNTDAGRIHRRAAAPELERTYDWIFSQPSTYITLVKTANGGIDWSDRYYLDEYVKKYPDKNVNLFYETDYYTGKFNEAYSHSTYYKDLRNNIPYKNIIYENNTYIISNLRHLTNKDLLMELDSNCQNLAQEIGVSRFNYFEEYSIEENNYYPNVFIC